MGRWRRGYIGERTVSGGCCSGKDNGKWAFVSRSPACAWSQGNMGTMSIRRRAWCMGATVRKATSTSTPVPGYQCHRTSTSWGLYVLIMCFLCVPRGGHICGFRSCTDGADGGDIGSCKVIVPVYTVLQRCFDFFLIVTDRLGRRLVSYDSSVIRLKCTST